MKLTRLKWFRKYLGGTWYKHKNTYQLRGLIFDYFWTNKYGEINRFTKVVEVEKYG